jgi:hypothetical protein
MALSNILVVSGAARFSTRDVWEGYCEALAGLGVNVVPYPTFSMLKLLSADLVCADILGKALNVDNRIDCVVFTDGLWFKGARAHVPKSIRQAGVPTVLIATDDPYESLPNAEALYTHIFSNEVSCAESPPSYLATATLLPPQIERTAEPKFHLSFVGTVFKDRLDLLLELARFCEAQRWSFLIAGKFPAGTDAFQEFRFVTLRSETVSETDKWQIYADSRVILNVFRSAPEGTASPNPRVFEVTAFGHGALLTGEPRSEVTRLFGESVYEFTDAESASSQLQAALENDEERSRRVEQAQQITLQGHLYQNRAADLLQVLRDRETEKPDASPFEDRIAWVTGCGRTGSTWLSEMLGEISGVQRWHEPYFGRLLKHVHDRPAERKRSTSFFASEFDHVWVDGLRDLFHWMVKERYPRIGEHSLIVKEVNTPELFDWVLPLFRSSRMILLIRDPFDILDSYLSLQKSGSWNSQFGEAGETDVTGRAERSATHISDTLWHAYRAFERFPDDQKLLVRYEALLADAGPVLIACGKLVGQDVSEEQAQAAAEKHRFDKYEKTGDLEFRRFGRAGSWQVSGNFTDEIAALAERILGPLRTRLGYDAEAATAPSDAQRAETLTSPAD